MNTLRDLITCLENQNAIGITIVKGYDDRVFISYQQLYFRASFYLKRLSMMGICPGQEFIIIDDDLERFLYMFWACILGGIIPVPVSLESGNADKLINILTYCVDPYIFCSKRWAGAAQSERINPKRVLPDDFFDDVEEDHNELLSPEYFGDENDLVFIQFSSGSTNKPKGVKLTSNNILCNIRAILKKRGITNTDRFLSWMPLTHDMGLIFFHLAPMLLGVAQTLIPTEVFIRQPLLWMETASENKATVTSGTNFCIDYFLKRLKPTEDLGWNLEGLNHLMLGAEMISVDLCNNFLNTMARYGLKQESLAPGYGLAEASLCVSVTGNTGVYEWVVLDRNHLSIGEPVKFTDQRNPSHTQVMCVGSIIHHVSVRIVDTEKKALGDTCNGLIFIKGQSITSGYYNNPVLTSNVIDRNRWLDTGDIGFVYNNKLYITGRYKDIIFYNGKNYFSNDLEALVVKHALAKWNEVVVSGFRTEDSEVNDHLVCFVRSKSKNLNKFHIKAQEIKRVLSAYAGVIVEQVVPVPQIPKTTSGKVQRFALMKRYLDQEWEDIIVKLAQLSRQNREEIDPNQNADADIETVIANCIADILGTDVALDESLTDYNLNSLLITQLYEQVNKKYPQLISVADLYEYTSISLLAEHIRAASSGNDANERTGLTSIDEREKII